MEHLLEDRRVADEADAGLRAGDGGVEQVPVHEHGRALVHRDDNRRVLRALGLVDRDCVGELEALAVLEGILDEAVVETDRQVLSEAVDLGDDADVAVEDALALLGRDAVAAADLPDEVVVVPDLHDLVADAEQGASDLLLGLAAALRVHLLLEELVQALDAERALPLRGHDLDVEGIHAEVARELVQHEGGDRCEDLIRCLTLDEEEVLRALAEVDRLAFIDFMGVYDDVRRGGLAEDVAELDGPDHAGGDDVAEDIAGTDRWQLVRVTDHDEAGAAVDGLQEGVHEEDVDHGHLVDDDDVALERIVFVALEVTAHLVATVFVLVRAALVLEEAVDRGGRPAGGLGHALRGAAGRGTEQDGLPFIREHADNGVDGRGFSGTRAAGDDEEAGVAGGEYGVALERIELDAVLFRDLIDRNRALRVELGVLDRDVQVLQHRRDLQLRVVDRRAVDVRRRVCMQRRIGVVERRCHGIEGGRSGARSEGCPEARGGGRSEGGRTVCR